MAQGVMCGLLVPSMMGSGCLVLCMERVPSRCVVHCMHVLDCMYVLVLLYNELLLLYKNNPISKTQPL